MLNRRALLSVLTFALAGLALTARGGADASSNLAPQAQVAASLISSDASGQNLGGQYVGTVHDSLWDGFYGSGRIFAQLVRYHDSVAGAMTFTFGSSQFGGAVVFLLKGTALTGTGLSADLHLNSCPVAEAATFSNGTLTGSYKAASGCSGDNGTFTLQEQCRYGSNSAAEQRFALKRC
ncbi:MAG TPA: hypothetical protein VIW73_01710 [Candidatus Cybelea sp.]